MKPNVEVEAKLQVLDPEQVQRLRTAQVLPAGYTLSEAQTDAVCDRYIDTPAATLLRHGYALRVRRRNGEWIIGLKSLTAAPQAGVHQRQEIEGPLRGDSAKVDTADLLHDGSRWPAAVQQMVRKIAGKSAQFHMVCAVQQERAVRLVYKTPPEHGAAPGDSATSPDGSQSTTSDDAPVAELSLDRVQAYADPGASAAIAEFNELEIERKIESDEGALQTLVEHLTGHANLRPVQTSKFERALRAAAARLPDMPAEEHGIQPAMHMADACRLIWRQQLLEAMLSEAGVRSDDDIEFVHAMRVAIRRTRAAHVLFGEHFQRKPVRRYMKQLRHTAKVLGRVRDLDVALDKLARHRKTLPKSERQTLKPLAKYWQRQRREPFAALTAWLDSAKYADFLAAYQQFCQTPGAGAKHYTFEPGTPPLVQVRHVMPSGILNRFEAVRRYEIVFERNESVPISTLHALRIDCKYLRYILEFARDLTGPDGQQLIKQLKRLQDQLGDLNDAAVTKSMLQQLPDKLHNAAVEEYIAAQDAIIAELCQTIPTAFRTFIAPDNRQLLATVVARL